MPLTNFKNVKKPFIIYKTIKDTIRIFEIILHSFFAYIRIFMMKFEKKDENKCVGGKLTLITTHYQHNF